MKNVLIISVAIIIAACGGGGGGGQSGDTPTTPPPSTGGTITPAPPPEGDQCLSGTSLVSCDSLNSGVVLNIGTSGGGGYCLSSLFSFGPCDPLGPSGNTVAAGILRWATDREPNNDSSTASIANFPPRQSRGQRTGFQVRGSVDSLNDVVDVFAFVVSARTRLNINLCYPDEFCGVNSPDRPIGVGVASIRILDSSGIEVFSTADPRTPGNDFKAELEGGVIHFLVVAAEASAGPDLQYKLSVMESYYQPEAQPVADSQPETDPLPEPDPEPEADLPPDPEADLAPDPEADLPPDPDPQAPVGLYPPTLSVHYLGGLNVQLDWLPPLSNLDGSVVEDLVGYNIYLTRDTAITDLESLELLETIDDPLILTRSYDLSDYDGYYIGVTAFKSQGVESVVREWFGIFSSP